MRLAYEDVCSRKVVATLMSVGVNEEKPAKFFEFPTVWTMVKEIESEWGHGMGWFGSVGAISVVRLNLSGTSCVGHVFVSIEGVFSFLSRF